MIIARRRACKTGFKDHWKNVCRRGVNNIALSFFFFFPNNFGWNLRKFSGQIKMFCLAKTELSIFTNTKEIDSFNKLCWNNWTSTCKQTNKTHTHKTPSTLFTNLTQNVRGRIIKVLENNIRENVNNLEFGDNFLDTTLKAQFIK